MKTTSKLTLRGDPAALHLIERIARAATSEPTANITDHPDTLKMLASLGDIAFATRAQLPAIPPEPKRRGRRRKEVSLEFTTLPVSDAVAVAALILAQMRPLDRTPVPPPSVEEQGALDLGSGPGV